METRGNSIGFNRGRGGRQYENAYRNDRFKNENDGQNRDINQRDNTGNFRNRGQSRGSLKVILEVKVEAEVDLIKVPM